METSNIYTLAYDEFDRRGNPVSTLAAPPRKGLRTTIIINLSLQQRVYGSCGHGGGALLPLS